MPLKFTVYTWYDKGNRFQQSNFRRWNRRLQTNRESYDVTVFYSDENAKIDSEKFQNLRFWRLHKPMEASQTALLNEAIRYSRSEILVYVSPDVMVRNLDLYRLANRVREDYTFAWLDLKKAIFQKDRGTIQSLWNKILWIFNLGRIEMYTRFNRPYEFFKASLFAVQKKNLGHIFENTNASEREELFRSDQMARGYLNYYFFHLINKSTDKNHPEIHNEGKSRSYDFSMEYPALYYSYKNTGKLLRLMFRTRYFHYALNIYRVLLPLMQITQLAFFILVWFSPWKSLNLLAFYGILASSLIADIFFARRKYNPFLVLLWFFSWLVA